MSYVQYVCDVEATSTSESTEYLNPTLPKAQIKNDGIGGKYDNMDYRDWETDRKSTRLNSSHSGESRMPSSA